MNFEAKNHPFWHNSNKKNYVDSSNVALHYETEGHGKGVHLLQMHEFDNVRIPITIATWFFFITIAKIGNFVIYGMIRVCTSSCKTYFTTISGH